MNTTPLVRMLVPSQKYLVYFYTFTTYFVHQMSIIKARVNLIGLPTSSLCNWLTFVLVLYIGINQYLNINTPIPFLLIYGSVVLAAHKCGLRAGLINAGVGAGFIIYAAWEGFGPQPLTGSWIQATSGIVLLVATAYLLGKATLQNDLIQTKLQNHQAALEKTLKKRTTALNTVTETLRQEMVQHKSREKELQLYQSNLETLLQLRTSEAETTLAAEAALQGLLSICCHCKSIRNDQGAWEALETYLMNRADIDFTHGICPDCFPKFYSDFFGDRKKDA